MPTDRQLPRHTDDVAARYEQQIEDCVRRRAELRRLDLRLSLARGLLFVAGLLMTIAAYVGILSAWWLGAAVVIFLVVAGWHERVAEQLQSVTARRVIVERHQWRMARDWRRLPRYAVDSPAEWQSMANDLDVTGAGSLFSWLNLASTPMGRDTLRDWLLERPDRSTVEDRQAVVSRLAATVEWRDELLLHGALLGDEAATPDSFLAWATGPGWLRRRVWLIWLARCMALALLILIALTATRVITLPTAFAAYGLVVGVNMVLSVYHTGTIHEIFGRISSKSNEVRHYLGMLRVATRFPERVGLLPIGDADVREVARDGLAHLESLRRILLLVHARHDTFLAIVHIVAQLSLLWEVHLLSWLEGWQSRSGHDAPRWFRAIGELEALTSLATIAYEQPTWVFPTFVEDTGMVRAGGLGHPLLPDLRRVTNDVELGPEGKCLLVTGSNMSGKSTLLRAIGVNVLLANAGGVVCADHLELPPCELGTSMRVHDSLVQGVSFFLAELIRLKEIVDAATRARHEGRHYLFLLDEILQGTNSRERHIAVVHVLRHLSRTQAIGAVSTHDLELGSNTELLPSLRTVHFRETLVCEQGEKSMTFDYRLHEGVCPTSNALVLLDMVGLGDKKGGP